jgi:hypothetical protein
MLVFCDELNTGSIDGANAGDLPCGLCRFERDDLKSRFAAQIYDPVLRFDVESATGDPERRAQWSRLAF